MKKVRSLADILTILIFFCVISIPLLTFHHEAGRISVLENKTAAQKPELSQYNLFDSQLTSDLDKYFSDNIGLKEEAVLSHISLMYRLFDKVAIPHYMAGKEQHTFYINKTTLRQYQGLDEMTASQTETLREMFLALDDAVEDFGSKLVFMPIPNKEQVYPEYMSDTICQVSQDNMFHEIKEDLLAHSEISVVDTEQALLAQKTDEDLLYFRNTDPTHWNSLGAYWGYQALMEQLLVIDPELSVLSPADVTIQQQEMHTPFSYLTQFEIIPETFSDLWDWDYTITPPDGWHGTVDNTSSEGISLAGDMQDRYFHYHNDAVEGAKSLVVFGDSYIYSFLLPFLSESFTDLYFVAANYCTQQQITEVLAAAEPDLIVFESVARMLNYDQLASLVDKLTVCVEDVSIYESAASLDLLPETEELSCGIRFDKDRINTEHVIRISEDTTDGYVILSGWAADFTNTVSSSGVFFKIGSTYLPAETRERPDLDEKLLDAGFWISIPAEGLDGLSSIQVVALTPDGTALFPRQTLQILP